MKNTILKIEKKKKWGGIKLRYIVEHNMLYGHEAKFTVEDSEMIALSI